MVLVDTKVDLKTGRIVIDTVTGDAVLISGKDAIIQGAAIRLRTQIGQVKRQDRDSFGWDLRSWIKTNRSLENLNDLIQKIKDVILLDPEIDDVDADFSSNLRDEEIEFDINIKIDGTILSLPFSLKI